jgi:uncharacterized damage-inducible protein DinB
MSKRIVLLQALASMPADLRLMLKRVDAAAASHSPSPTQWSILQALAHLLHVEERYLARLHRVVSEDNPFLPTIHPDHSTLPTTPHPVLLNQLEAARTQTLAFLQALSPGSWQRPALHETQGATKFRYLVQMLVDHDTQHLNQIIEIQQLSVGPHAAAPPAIPKPT